MAIDYKNPAGSQIGTIGDYRFFVFVIENNQNIRIFSYGHLTDGLWHKGPIIQPNIGELGGLGVFRNRQKYATFEIIVSTGLGTYQHISYKADTKGWQMGKSFGKVEPNGYEGPIAVFQNNAPKNYNYEVIVREGDHLQHYWYDYSSNTWNKGQSFGRYLSSPSAFQNRSPNNYHYEVIAREGDHLQHYWYDHLGDGKWHRGRQLTNYSNVRPFLATAAFQDQYANKYGYEIIVSRSNSRTLYRFNYGHLTDGIWHGPYPIVSSPAYYEFQIPTAFQNHTPNNYNYEVIVPVKHIIEPKCYLQHYWRDYSTGNWNKGQSFG